ncbi:MAG TPA: ABC transporter substrate-binding protein [Candidatus Acidoferrales bacterium]|nr:ABC transporter substrate-binding protein [Candidatus Acidoferrales bacterium]
MVTPLFFEGVGRLERYWHRAEAKSTESSGCAGQRGPIELKIRMAFAPSVSRQRIVSLAPNATSILVAIGALRQLVAVSRWCKEVADVSGLPELGDCWALDTEPILRLKPTLIVGSVPFKSETVQKILTLPVPFLALNPRSLADIEADIHALGRLAEASARAEALVREMRRKFDAVQSAARRAKSRPRVYAEAWPSPRISSPPWVAELIEMAGGEMIVPAGERISDEDVARARPELIVLAWTATGDKAKPAQALENPAWQDVPALKERRIAVIRDELLNTPGPPLVRGAEELFRSIHPELSIPSRRRRGD